MHGEWSMFCTVNGVWYVQGEWTMVYRVSVVGSAECMYCGV